MNCFAWDKVSPRKKHLFFFLQKTSVFFLYIFLLSHTNVTLSKFLIKFKQWSGNMFGICMQKFPPKPIPLTSRCRLKYLSVMYTYQEVMYIVIHSVRHSVHNIKISCFWFQYLYSWKNSRCYRWKNHSGITGSITIGDTVRLVALSIRRDKCTNKLHTQIYIKHYHQSLLGVFSFPHLFEIYCVRTIFSLSFLAWEFVWKNATTTCVLISKQHCSQNSVIGGLATILLFELIPCIIFYFLLVY